MKTARKLRAVLFSGISAGKNWYNFITVGRVLGRAFLHSVRGEYGDVPVRFLGRKELISNKRTIGRYKDLGDIEALGEKVWFEILAY